MMFQTWSAFGIMFGYVMNFAFRNVRDPPGIRGLNWRLMLGSVSIGACPSEVLTYVYHVHRLGSLRLF